MSKTRTGKRSGPFRIETVRGEPYRIGGRTLTPVARVITLGKARATVGSRQTGGWGFGFVHVTPLAMVEQTAQGERCISLRGDSSAAMGKLIGAAVAVTLVCTVARRLLRRGS